MTLQLFHVVCWFDKQKKIRTFKVLANSMIQAKCNGRKYYRYKYEQVINVY